MNQITKDTKGQYHVYGFLVVPKPVSIFGDYIALHSLVPKNELPHHIHIPPNQIWMREDIYNDRLKRNMTLIHEKAELKRMTKGMTYKEAHKWAEMSDGLW